MMTITWEAVVALCAFTSIVVGALFAVTRMIVSSALLEFEHRFFERLNGRYIKAELCVERHQESERRLAVLENE